MIKYDPKLDTLTIFIDYQNNLGIKFVIVPLEYYNPTEHDQIRPKMEYIHDFSISKISLGSNLS